MSLEQFLTRRLRRLSKTENRKIPVGVIKDALTAYLQPLNMGKEIIDTDIPCLTTGEIDIKIYWR